MRRKGIKFGGLLIKGKINPELFLITQTDDFLSIIFIAWEPSYGNA